HQLEEPLLPGLDADFPVDPGVGPGSEKLRGDPVGLPSGLLGAAGGRFHHPAISAAAHRKSGLGQGPAERARFRVVRVLFPRTRAAENGDDALHLWAPRSSHSACLQQAEPGASNSSIMAMLRASSASVASWPREPMLLLMNEKTMRRPLGR